MKGIFYISVTNFMNNKRIIFKTNLGTAKKKKTNMKKTYIYENDHFSYVHEKNHYKFGFFIVHEFVLNISFLLLFTKLFTVMISVYVRAIISVMNFLLSS
jgi:hypothetical protein